ncbi:hypothetical protein PLICRDRAFT_113009 [Plicaturopsis crispa FD-325 SS-3]|nr:hypothetical protein PLICRDRAFT_113009 [Plicaturopsis crispa FD-325 SS-3]
MLYQHRDVPKAVRSLLNATKELQNSLKQWSILRATEGEVSDAYVRVGTDFNNAIQAFSYHSIDLSDIHSVPGDLRAVLEQCLGEDPSTEAYETFIPDVRRILYMMLQGLKSKQTAYWRSVKARPGRPGEI